MPPTPRGTPIAAYDNPTDHPLSHTPRGTPIGSHNDPIDPSSSHAPRPTPIASYNNSAAPPSSHTLRATLIDLPSHVYRDSPIVYEYYYYHNNMVTTCVSDANWCGYVLYTTNNPPHSMLPYK